MGLCLSINATPASVLHVNNRTEKHGEDEVVGQDVKIRMAMPVAILDQFAIDETTADWRGFLYEDDGVPRALGIKPIRSKLEFEEHIITISYVDRGTRARKKFDEVNVKAIAFEPVAGFNLHLTMQLQIHPKDAGEMGWLVQMLSVGEASVKVEPPKQRDAFSDPPNSDEEEREDASA